MFDNDYGIALISEVLERSEEVLVITRVQANARFVEDVNYPSQTRPNLTG
jgi:hypothetical protein